MQAFLVICAICLQLNSLTDHSSDSLQQRDSACNQCLGNLNKPQEIIISSVPESEPCPPPEPMEPMVSIEPIIPHAHHERMLKTMELHIKDTLKTGEFLNRNESLFSKNGIYSTWMQLDGNFVVYHNYRDPTGNFAPTWHASTYGYGDKIVMENNGNLVIYDNGGNKQWETVTEGNGHFVRLENDGRLMMYNPYGDIVKEIAPAPIWPSME